jgi:multidrug efflux pump subunit AcrB
MPGEPADMHLVDDRLRNRPAERRVPLPVADQSVCQRQILSVFADVATIEKGYADPPQPMFRFNGEPAIGLAISMAQGGNNLVFGGAVAHKMEQITAHLPIGIEGHLVADQPVVVEEAVGGFSKALWEAIAIVLAVSFLSLSLRAGVVVACSIPLVLGMVFVYMEWSGISLQRISLGALIIALGLLVDDAMITIEMMVSQLELGVDREHAATHAWVTTAFPMLTGTLVTVAGFVPIGFAKSGVGEYCYSLFAVIAVPLLASWIVAVLFAPVIGVTILPKTMKPHGGGHGEPGRFMRLFRAALLFCMRARWLVIAVTVGLFATSLYGYGFIQQQFFPPSDRPELVVDLSLPQDSSIYATEHEVERFEALLKDDPNIDRYSLDVGQGAVRFYLPLNVQLSNDYFAQAVIVTKGIEEREIVRQRLQRALDTEFASLNTRIYPLELGPPVGWPLQYRVSGQIPEGTRDAAFLVAQTIGQNPNTRLVNFDWNEPMKSLRVQVDQDRVRQLGVSSKSLAEALNAVTSGMVVSQVRDSIYLTDLTARATEQQRASVQTLRNLQVALDNGQTIPLSQVATVQYELEPPVIWRRNLLPTITMQADVAPGIEAKTVNEQLAPAIAIGGEIAGGLLGRSRRHDRRKRKGAQLDRRRLSADDHADADHSHGAVAELPEAVPGDQRRTLGCHWRCRGSAADRHTDGVCRDPRDHCFERHDHPQFRHPDRPDRHGYCERPAPVGCRGRRYDPSFAADCPDRRRSLARHDSDRVRGVLGTDGLRHHRRSLRRDAADLVVSSGSLCRMVPHQRAGKGATGRSCRANAGWRRLTKERGHK